MLTVWQQLLDRLAVGETLICADEIRRWDRKQWEEALGLGLLREIELSDSTVCDQCGDAHWAGIYWEVPGVKACFGCDIEGVIDIDIDRLRQWRIDRDRMAVVVAGAFDLRGQTETLLPDRLWRIGRRRLGGRYREIFIGIGSGVPVPMLSATIRSSVGSGLVLLLTLGADGNSEELPMGQNLLDLASVTRIENARISLDFDYLEERLGEVAVVPNKSAQTVSATAGTTWRDVSIVLFEDSLQITLGGRTVERNPGDAGFGVPDQRLELFRLFAAARGTLGVSKMSELLAGETPPKKRVARLRQLLQDLIDIDGDPIQYSRSAAMYICEFEIRLAVDTSFSAPQGTSWLELTFHERTDGRILVTIPEKQYFRAHGPNVDDRKTGDVAERYGVVTRTHSLAEIGLRSEVGRLTVEGSAFLSMLRASGTLARSGNDMMVLRLAKRLRDWSGLADEPFRLSETTRSWTAVFACSSDLANLEARLLPMASPRESYSEER